MTSAIGAPTRVPNRLTQIDTSVAAGSANPVPVTIGSIGHSTLAIITQK